MINGRWRRLLVALTLGGGLLNALPAGAEDPSTTGTLSHVLRIAREGRASWKLGRFEVREKDGKPLRVRVDLIAGGRVVGRLRVDPSTGGFLGQGEQGGPAPALLDLARLRGEAERALQDVEVGNRTWPTDHGRAWRVPLHYQGRVVGTIKIDVRQGRLGPKDKSDD